MASCVPLLSSLRQAPEVGRLYMVPVVRSYPWHSRVDDWPVIGPAHADVEFFNFPHIHYHLDPRFLTAAQERFIARQGRRAARFHGLAGEEIDIAVSGYPVSSRDDPLPKGRPQIVRRRCRRASYGFALLGHRVDRLREHFGNPAEPIRRRDGRLLCPHRKVDLSQFPADAEGIVTCPLHGLRVRCGAPA